MDDAAQFLDAFAKPCQFFGTYPVVLGIAGFGVRFLQLLELGAFGVRGFRPYAIEAAVQPFGQRAEKGDVVVVGCLCRTANYAAPPWNDPVSQVIPAIGSA
ncbi:hypothetical protein TZ53_10940 [Sphingobium sp. YBL2]|nr:hypothetical protein TZ53_10940 [Sphingobium sp. YBL2]